MPTIARLVNLVLFLLSVSLISFATPTSESNYSDESGADLTPNTNYNEVLRLLADLEGNIKVPMKLIADAQSYAEVRTQVDVVVAHLDECSSAVLAASKLARIEESVKVDIANKAVAIISMIVQACLEVSLRLGWSILFGIFAKIDVCLKALIINLGAYGEGLAPLITKTVASACAQLLISLNFSQCMNVLAITGL